MSIPINWRSRKQRYSLRAEECVHSRVVVGPNGEEQTEEIGRHIIFPPRDVCPEVNKQVKYLESRGVYCRGDLVALEGWGVWHSNDPAYETSEIIRGEREG